MLCESKRTMRKDMEAYLAIMGCVKLHVLPCFISHGSDTSSNIINILIMLGSVQERNLQY